MAEVGQIIILNGAPRSGKSSIVQAIQENFAEPWMNLGVDIHVDHITPRRYRPGIGLRPGGERPDIEILVPRFYAALYESIAAHSRLGLNVVADFGHHDIYSKPLHVLVDCARRLDGLPVLFVGVRCPIEVILERRARSAAEKGYVTGSLGDPAPLPVRLWQEAVHNPGLYDLEVDTSLLSPAQCANAIQERLQQDLQPTAFEKFSDPSFTGSRR
ncbi:chloramphenicol phosphotransferase [Mesorhizobium sp. YC-39]|uniref:chloramphenicol phosphotransferase CPT family protein n=1 Tax=unclassified Mesorhizobium TaxID=325217 RepID=UPI0021E7D40B|nr:MULTISPECIES: chloramphenicol phosphotransferase [unclassified Mesorhizobium]MCV3208399.1 chloramphenicol phosphotransferase [Mesorhizobium sp. YC-2]MCV3232251.1 chloramphenicol phosphotransferase [Mesorhizobium sp. YC-39]